MFFILSVARLNAATNHVRQREKVKVFDVKALTVLNLKMGFDTRGNRKGYNLKVRCDTNEKKVTKIKIRNKENKESKKNKRKKCSKEKMRNEKIKKEIKVKRRKIIQCLPLC